MRGRATVSRHERLAEEHLSRTVALVDAVVLDIALAVATVIILAVVLLVWIVLVNHWIVIPGVN